MEQVCSLVKDSVNFVKEMWDQASFFFVTPESYDAEVVKKRWKPEIPAIFQEIIQLFNNLDDFSSSSIHDSLHRFLEEKQYNFGQVMNCLRLSMVGTSKGPDLPVIMEFLGKKEVIFRIEKAVKMIS